MLIMVLNVRGVPDALITRLKMLGLICNCSLKDCVIQALTEWVDGNDKLDAQMVGKQAVADRQGRSRENSSTNECLGDSSEPRYERDDFSQA